MKRYCRCQTLELAKAKKKQLETHRKDVRIKKSICSMFGKIYKVYYGDFKWL